MNSCDLYIHASDAEIEGISCMEALACGLVPVISDSERSATNQYALDERSLFKAGDAGSLAEKIDYWVSNPEERERMGKEYAHVGDGIRVSACVAQAEAMYRDAIQEYHDHGYKHPRQGPIKRRLHPNTEKIESAEFSYCPSSGFRRELLAFLTNLFTPLLFFIDALFFGFSVEGRRHLEGVDGRRYGHEPCPSDGLHHGENRHLPPADIFRQPSPESGASLYRMAGAAVRRGADPGIPQRDEAVPTADRGSRTAGRFRPLLPGGTAGAVS